MEEGGNSRGMKSSRKPPCVLILTYIFEVVYDV